MAIQMRRGNNAYYDESKMKPGEVAVATDTRQAYLGMGNGDAEELAFKRDLEGLGSGGGGGTTDHNALINREVADQHPISAITGLQEALDDKQPAGEYLTSGALQAATNLALEQAKASGEFDGLSPFIGANGNWWIGEEDTGVAAGGSGSGSVAGKKLIWQNAAPNSDFVANASLPVANMNDFNFLYVVFKVVNNYVITGELPKDASKIGRYGYSTVFGSNMAFLYRDFQYVDATTLSITSCAQITQGSTSTSIVNNFLIPLAIYGSN